MNKYLTQLVELCDYDKQIESFKPQIQAAENKLRSKRAQIDNAKNESEKLQNEISDIKSQISKTNAQLAAFSSKIKSSSKKSASVKTEKEIKALSIEEDIAKEQLMAANDEIERLEKLITFKEEQKNEFDESVKTFESELEILQNEVSQEMEKVEEVRSKISAKRDVLVDAMNPKTFSFYEKIRKWAGNTAVSPVRKQACYGCFMKLSDKAYASVIKSDDIVTCPYCGRILYKEN